MRAHARDVDQAMNPFLAPAFAVAMWNPFLPGAATWNGEAQEGYATFVGEWQSFVARRFKEDMALALRLASCTAPVQVWSAYVDFWQKAAEDYIGESGTMGKLAAGIGSKTWKATQSAADQTARSALLSRKAA